MFDLLLNRVRRLFGLSKEPSSVFLYQVLGFRPKNEAYYYQALTHCSIAPLEENNERLEFLGDSLLSAVVSNYLYEQMPHASEGELSAKRSEWVSRNTNNAVAEHLGLKEYLRYNKANSCSKDMLGNTLEALIGAIFLDYGYDGVNRFFRERLLPIVQGLEHNEELPSKNYKSLLLELSQKKGFVFEYQLIFAPKHGRGIFRMAVAFGTDYEHLKPLSEGRGKNKKEAQQQAARLAIEEIKKIYPDLV